MLVLSIPEIPNTKFTGTGAGSGKLEYRIVALVDPGEGAGGALGTNAPKPPEIGDNLHIS